MKTKNIITVLLIAVILASCAPAAKVVPTETPVPPTETPVPPTETPVPPTETPVPIPTLSPETVGGLEGIPDPHATNPELFNLTRPDAPIPQFASAFGVNPEEVGQLTPQLLTGVDGKPFVVMVTGDLPSTNYDESGIPLMIAEQGEDGEWGWREATSRRLAEKAGVELGTAGRYADSTVSPLIKNYFTLLVSDWEFHWNTTDHPLRPTLDSFDFRYPDDIIRYSQRNEIPLQVHHLIFGDRNTLPDWLLRGNFSREQLLDIIENHIVEVMGRYRGKVSEWTVINELSGLPWHTSFWYEKLGSNLDWIEMAFRVAHDTDPNAKLILNDAGIEFYGGDSLYGSQRAEETFQLVRKLREDGVPIDGVGFQMHLYGKDFKTEQEIQQRLEALRRNIRRYREIGVEVYVTEMDIRMNGVLGNPPERNLTQARAYQAIMDVLLEEGVNSISIFGVRDKDSWLENPNINGADAPNSDPLLFDDNGFPKPSYYAVVASFFKHFNR